MLDTMTTPMQPRPGMAADGAPTSNILPATQTHALIDVVLVANPDFRLKIAASSFDPAVHVKAAPPPPPKPRRERPTFGTESEADLLTLTLPKLREMPEVAFIETPASTKADLIKQILAVRGQD